MKTLNGFPFDPLDDLATPCGGGKSGGFPTPG